MAEIFLSIYQTVGLVSIVDKQTKLFIRRQTNEVVHSLVKASQGYAKNFKFHFSLYYATLFPSKKNATLFESNTSSFLLSKKVGLKVEKK